MVSASGKQTSKPVAKSPTKIFDALIGETGNRSSKELRELVVSAGPEATKLLQEVVKAKTVHVGADSFADALRDPKRLRGLIDRIYAPVSSARKAVSKSAKPSQGKTKRKAKEKTTGKSRAEGEPTTEYRETNPQTVLFLREKLTEMGLIENGVVTIGEIKIDDREALAALLEMRNYSEPRNLTDSLQRRINSIGGAFYELLIPSHPTVKEGERRVALAIVEEVIRRRANVMGLRSEDEIRAAIGQAKNGIDVQMAGGPPLENFQTPIIVPGQDPEGPMISPEHLNLAFSLAGVVARGPKGVLFMLRLRRTRDINGKLVSDHFRCFVSFDDGNVDIVPIGIGESKFKSGATKIIRQLIQSFARSGKGVIAENLAETGKIKVSWASKVVAIAQSEEKITDPQLVAVEEEVKGAIDEPDVNIKFAPVVDPDGANDAREFVKAVLNVAGYKLRKMKK